MKGAGAPVRWLNGLANDMRFANPRALLSWEADRDGVTGCFESGDQGVNIWRGLLRWRTIIVDYLAGY